MNIVYCLQSALVKVKIFTISGVKSIRKYNHSKINTNEYIDIGGLCDKINIT